MKLKVNPHITNIEFVLQECLRLKQLINTGKFTEIPKEDLLHDLRTSDKNIYMCGRAAALRLELLTEEIARRGNLLEKVSNETLRKPMENLIIERFVKEKRPIDTKQVDRLFSTVIKIAKSKCVQLTHFIPCHLMTSKDPSVIELGPVCFHNKSSFRRLLIAKIRAQKKTASTLHSRMLMSEAIKYFRHFQWVAEVTITSADTATSAKLAEQAVISALDCLHLLLRAQFTDRMRVGGPAIKRDKRARLTLLSSGELSPSTSWSSIQQVNYQDGWSSQLLDPEINHFLKLFSIVLEVAVDPSLERPLSRRFLDAAQWFGEASRDTSPSTKIVKFVTSLERMVMTEEHNDISHIVSDRVAFFCADEVEGFNIWKERALKIYNLRSRLVHGSMSPRTLEITRSLHICATIAERTILNCLFNFGDQALKVNVLSSNKLGNWFKDQIKLTEGQETNLDSLEAAG